MNKKTVAAAYISLLAVLLLHASAPAQGKGRPASHKNSKILDRDSTPPAFPVEVWFGYYRDDNKAIFLTIRNNDKARRIASVSCSISINDALNAKSRKLSIPEFDYQLNVRPGETGTAVICEEDPVTIDWRDHVAGACEGYSPVKDENRMALNGFAPGQCRSETYTLFVEEVRFSDGSVWQGQK